MDCPEICPPQIKGKRFQEPRSLGQGLTVWFSYLYSSYLLLLAVSLQWKRGKSRSHTPHTTLLGLTVLNYQNAGCHTKHEDKAMRLMFWQERLHLSPTKNMALKGSHLGGWRFIAEILPWYKNISETLGSKVPMACSFELTNNGTSLSLRVTFFIFSDKRCQELGLCARRWLSDWSSLLTMC